MCLHLSFIWGSEANHIAGSVKEKGRGGTGAVLCLTFSSPLLAGINTEMVAVFLFFPREFNSSHNVKILNGLAGCFVKLE